MINKSGVCSNVHLGALDKNKRKFPFVSKKLIILNVMFTIDILIILIVLLYLYYFALHFYYISFYNIFYYIFFYIVFA